MTHQTFRYLLTAALLWCQSISAGPLPDELTRALARQKIPAGAASFLVVEAAADSTPLLSFNAGQARHPASVIKLLTTFAALQLLGPGYIWKTEAWTDAPVRDGVLKGNLYLKGYGDPFLTTERFWQLLSELRLRGLQRIEGNLVVDESYFAPAAHHPGDFDDRPLRVYNAPPAALILNFQSTRFTLIPDRDAGRVRVAVSPPLDNMEVENRLRLVEGKCSNRHYRPSLEVSVGANTSTVVLKGDYAAACEDGNIYRLVGLGSRQIYGAFQALWEELGGTLDGGLRIATVPSQAMLFYAMDSLPLSDLIRGMNKFSNNLMTRQLALTLGATLFDPPATEAKARDAIDVWLADSGLKLPYLVFDNGAGLSRKTRISATGLGQILTLAFASPTMPEFISSLPLVAVDGTMRKRLRDEAVAGRAHIKTGSLDTVSAMAGYLLSRSGRRYIVVALLNHPGLQSWQGKLVQDALLRWVYEH